MKHYTVRLSPEAQTDLVHIYGYVVERSGSTVTADRYIERISGFLVLRRVSGARNHAR
jgi:plasmid stabilization system protein ParE